MSTQEAHEQFVNDIRGINHLWACTLLEELSRLGVQNICLAPGARSAPFAAALSEPHNFIVTVHQDERGLGFFALGCAKASGIPPVIITTSGTAVANLLPAVIEAYQTHTPLLILTADRPAELLDTGANQTIKQADLFGSYTVWISNIPAPTPEVDPLFLLSLADHAFAQSTGIPGGPVHLNCQFREPLLTESAHSSPIKISERYHRWKGSQTPFMTHISPRQVLTPKDCTEICQTLAHSKRGAIVCGALEREDDQRAVVAIAQKLQWPLLADITSGLRSLNSSPLSPDRRAVHYDLYLREGTRLHELIPDTILHFGGLPVSRTLLSYLSSRQSSCIQVTSYGNRLDPSGFVSMKVQTDLKEFSEALHRDTHTYGSSLAEEFMKLELVASRYLDQLYLVDSLSEWRSVRLVFELAPKGSLIYLGNSLPIRHADTFAPLYNKDLKVGYHRGASGIDGTIACAAGYGRRSHRNTFVIIGDMSFFHDTSSLPLGVDDDLSFTLVVLNNDGGGIFSYLPTLSELGQFEGLFAAPHGFSCEGLAKTYGYEYLKPRTLGELRAVLSSQMKVKSRIIEVETERSETVAEYKRLLKEAQSLFISTL
jgi:2-succinyl-5-enolpyruvyl-6-hydroxy-3-cyclohexene-1-carboxylate synthase